MILIQLESRAPAKDPRRDRLLSISRRNNEDRLDDAGDGTRPADEKHWQRRRAGERLREWQREARRRIRATKRLVTSLGTAAALYVIACTI